MKEILEAAHKSIESSVVILDGKLRDSTDKLESQFTKPKSKSGAKSARDEEVQTVQVSILVPCVSTQHRILLPYRPNNYIEIISVFLWNIFIK